jgi:hypothetical protein
MTVQQSYCDVPPCTEHMFNAMQQREAVCEKESRGANSLLSGMDTATQYALFGGGASKWCTCEAVARIQAHCSSCFLYSSAAVAVVVHVHVARDVRQQHNSVIT